jgi:S1-C subfamily serine protease
MKANLNSLKQLRKIPFLLIISFTIFSNTQAADNKFCLEEDGFIMPIIEQKCNDIISINEFKHLITLEQKQRSRDLVSFRKLAEKPIKTEKKIVTVEEAKKVTNEIIKKNIYEQKRLERLAILKEKKIKKLKKIAKQRIEYKVKSEAQQKIAKENKFKRDLKLKNKKLAKEEKKLANKREKEAKLQFRKAKLEKDKIKREAKLQLRRVKLEQDRINKKEQSDQKKITKVSKTPVKTVKAVINQDLKVIMFDKKIVKNELFPEIDEDITVWKSNGLQYKTVFELDKNSFKEILETNTNLIVILPRDFDSFANSISQNKMSSRVVSGSRQIPNPEFSRLEMSIRDAEKKSMMAKREAEFYERKLSNPNRQSSGVGWLDILSVVTEGVASATHENTYRSLQNKVTSLIGEYSTTPMFLDKEVFSTYAYSVNKIDAEKKAEYDIVLYNNGKFYKNSFNIKDKKSFDIASGINSRDKNYDNLIKKYSTENDLNQWTSSKFKDVQLSNLLAKLENNSAEEIKSKTAYKLIDSSYVEEKKSFWDKLFTRSSKKESKKIASLSKSNKYEISDNRFESVVIVKTESGLGSGFYVSEDEILTNYHVIENSNNIVTIDRNKNRSSAVVIKKDLKRDLALLKTNSKGKSVSFYSGPIKQGSKVEALGHPKGRKFSLSQGIVSAIRKEVSVYSATDNANVLYIQTDAAINPGNSGGPLFLENKVVGVNTQGLSKKKTEGMNFAIHYSEVLKFLK